MGPYIMESCEMLERLAVRNIEFLFEGDFPQIITSTDWSVKDGNPVSIHVLREMEGCETHRAFMVRGKDLQTALRKLHDETGRLATVKLRMNTREYLEPDGEMDMLRRAADQSHIVAGGSDEEIYDCSHCIAHNNVAEGKKKVSSNITESVDIKPCSSNVAASYSILPARSYNPASEEGGFAQSRESENLFKPVTFIPTSRQNDVDLRGLPVSPMGGLIQIDNECARSRNHMSQNDAENIFESHGVLGTEYREQRFVFPNLVQAETVGTQSAAGLFAPREHSPGSATLNSGASRRPSSSSQHKIDFAFAAALHRFGSRHESSSEKYSSCTLDPTPLSEPGLLTTRRVQLELDWDRHGFLSMSLEVPTELEAFVDKVIETARTLWDHFEHCTKDDTLVAKGRGASGAMVVIKQVLLGAVPLPPYLELKKKLSMPTATGERITVKTVLFTDM